MARIKQADAAAALDISQPELSRRIAGTRAWRDGEIERIAAMCGVPAESLRPESTEVPA